MSRLSTGTRDIDAMDHREFEYFIADLWRRKGYEAHPTSASGDGGVDIVAENEAERLAIEAKWRTDGKLGPEYARRIAGVAERSGFDRGLVVTNVGFTDAAYREANDMNVQLVDGEKIRALDEQTHRASPSSSDVNEGRSKIGAIGNTAANAIVAVLEDPDKLVNVVRILIILFVMYVIVDGFGQVIGINLPGGL